MGSPAPWAASYIGFSKDATPVVLPGVGIDWLCFLRRCTTIAIAQRAAAAIPPTMMTRLFSTPSPSSSPSPLLVSGPAGPNPNPKSDNGAAVGAIVGLGVAGGLDGTVVGTDVVGEIDGAMVGSEMVVVIDVERACPAVVVPGGVDVGGDVRGDGLGVGLGVGRAEVGVDVCAGDVAGVKVGSGRVGKAVGAVVGLWLTVDVGPEVVGVRLGASVGSAVVGPAEVGSEPAGMAVGEIVVAVDEPQPKQVSAQGFV